MTTTSPERTVLVHLETSGNQAFIFGTNKLKENVGASEMTYRAGTEAVARAVNHVFGLSGEDRMPEEAARPDGLASWLLRQPAIEASARPVEVLLATSGKALVLVRGEVRARELVRAWSTHLAVRLPGVDGLGVVSEPFALGSGGTDGCAVGAAVGETHRRFEAARALRPSPEARFSRLPLAATCEVSGLPAEVLLRREGGPPEQLSHVSAVKRAHLDAARERFAEIFGERSRYRIPESLDAMLDLWSFDWLGVVHADGNGLGQLFLRFESIARALAGEAPSLDRAYVDLYREFSVELDRIAREVFAEVAYEAFGEARKVFPERDRAVHLLPVLPIIVGGDDLTVVCDGQRALPFVRLYLATLEKRLAGLDRTQVLTRVLQEHFGVPRFGMAAGVALVKPKFPFFSAYALAGQLTDSAKAVKQHVRSAGEAHPASALDFHVTFESSVLDLPSARERLVATRGKASYRLHGRPYVTTPTARLEEEGVEDLAWARAHAFTALEAARKALASTVDGDSRRAFPASQAHRVRTTLRRDPEGAERTFAHLLTRYEAHGFSWPEPDGRLWVDAPGGAPSATLTRFQDALETLELFREPWAAGGPPAGSQDEVTP